MQIVLDKLRNNPNLVIMLANKNLGLVLLDCDWYLREGYMQLADVNVYKHVDMVPFEELQSGLEYVCHKYMNFIPKEEIMFILHKPTNNYRVYNGFIFEHTSIWLHHKLHPILQCQKQHL